MASGFSYSGKQPRCFPYWQELAQCYEKTEFLKVKCMPQQADYLECLHGTKQAVRDLQINAELQKQLAHKKNDERKAADILPGASIGGTGLIKKDEAA